MERLVLIDGTGLIYRAYFALPSNLTTKAGLHTNAILGFSNTFSKLLSKRIPEYAAVVFDAPGGSFRKEKFADYKAQRPKADDDLIEQLPWIDKVVEAHNFPILRIPGFEADDVIGTLAHKARLAGMEVIIISSDKDFAQLIDEQVKMHDSFRDVTYDPELVRKKWGVPPHQFRDYLALVGDKVDNIPGVPGIGPKGASTLLDTYGTLSQIYANLDKVVGKTKTNLEEFRAQAFLSQELATIELAVPLPMELSDLRYQHPKVSELNDLYRELEFYSLLSDGTKAKQAQSEVADESFVVWEPGSPTPSATLTAFQLMIDGLAVDGNLSGLAFYDGENTYFADAKHLDHFKVWLEDDKSEKVVHDLRPTLVALWKHGISPKHVQDTRLASFLVDPTKVIPHDLHLCVKEYLQRTLAPTPKAADTSSRGSLSIQQSHACHQALLIHPLWLKLTEELKSRNHWQLYLDSELPLTPVLAAMQRDGVKVDKVDLDKLGVEFRERLVHIETEVYRLAGHNFNIGSTKQLGTVLFDELKLPVIKKTKTGYSTDAEVLERLAPKHPIANQLLEHRKLAKLINTYTDVLADAINPISGRVHASYQQTTSATGRLISTDPDLQRTPVRTTEGARIRFAFVAQDEHWKMISADWSQIELRVMAYFSGDPLLVEAFQNNLDIHRRTASQLFKVTVDEVTPPQREVAKTVNFATIYGQGANALGQILDIPKKTAQEYIEQYFLSYSRVRAWLDNTMEQAHRDGFVTTILGRRRYLPELSSRNFAEKQAGERIAANTPIQGTAADLCKLAMLEIYRQLNSQGLKARMVMQIHDELVLESPVSEVEAASHIVRSCMENVHPLVVLDGPCKGTRIPLLVNLGVGSSWGEAH
jgi:DNA polymerase-1